MRDDFAVFILTHGRPQNVITLRNLLASGYTGKVFIVVDDEDKTRPEYIEVFGDKVLTFSKEEISKTFDSGDNFKDRRTIIYARNACFELAKQVGVKYFMQLDDDYNRFSYRFDREGFYSDKTVLSMDALLEAMIEYFEAGPFLTIAMAQGGDHLGGGKGTYARKISTKRKAMNTFLCSTERPFSFVGRINEDVNTYTSLATRGGLFLTLLGVSIVQRQTQSAAGGMTETYLDSGTYVKSFYSVIFCPSAVKLTMMGEKHRRIHHKVNWNAAAPKILRASVRK